MISWSCPSVLRPLLALALITVLWVPLSACTGEPPGDTETPDDTANETQSAETVQGSANTPESGDDGKADEVLAEDDKSVIVDRGEALVTAANPLAVDAGLEILRKGGNAVDAALAVQAALGLVEPQSSGLGGGAFALLWTADDRSLVTYDGREISPASATPDMFLTEDGKPMSYLEAFVGGKSVGVPGLVAMLEMMHKEHGSLPLDAVFAPAIRLAEEGFAISPRLHGVVGWLPVTKEMPDTRAYFFDENGEQYPVGHILRNPAYAQTLRMIASEGAQAFYSGAFAEAIAEKVRSAPVNPAGMTAEDIAAYAPTKRDAICSPYRSYTVCSMAPPTSGGVLVLQALTMLERFDLSALEPGSVEAVHLISEASRLAYADRDQYIADPDVMTASVEGMLNRDYLAARSQLIDPEKSMGVAAPGEPPAGDEGEPLAPDTDEKLPGTSHFSIVDGKGNVMSMTTTVEFIFGSHLMVNGFFLNNQLTDFSFLPEKDGKPVANAVGPRKRPRSSMTPVIVFDEEDNPVMAIGSPGGSRIPAYVLQSVIAVLDWDMDIQEAVSLPHHLNRNGVTELEEGTDIVVLKEALEALGHQVRINRHTSGLHGFVFTEDGIVGAADPRREGVARGL